MKRHYLADWINIDRSVARSVNLERDASNLELLNRFQITSMVREMLDRLESALNGESINAWSLTGPYGTGKTAFCNFLIALTSGSVEERNLCQKKIQQADPDISKRLQNHLKCSNKDTPQFIGIRAVSRYESLNSTLTRALLNSIEQITTKTKNPHYNALHTRISELYQKDWPPTKELIDLFQQLANITNRKVILVVDEFGKSLEYQLHNNAQGDIFALQALAESKDIYLWVCLHQAFIEYASSLNRVQKEEWEKIQGRFEDKSYIEPPSRTFELICDSLFLTNTGIEHKPAIKRWAKAVIDDISQLKILNFPKLDENSVAELYPIHPLCAFFMGELTRRFAQNDRTLFSFLASGESKAFSAFLRQHEFTDLNKIPTLGLDTIYDYFSEISTLRYSDRSENQRWLEIQTLISSHTDIPVEKLRILKVIGILNLLSSLPGVSASEETIHIALSSDYYSEKRHNQSLLEELRREQILLYRSYANEYRLWEGSDFDLDAELIKVRSQVALRPITEVLSDILPRPNLIASRHSYQSGTLREFAVKWCVEDEMQNLINEPWPDYCYDGIVWLMIGREHKIQNIETITRQNQPVIVAYSPCQEQLRRLMIEAAATEIITNAPQLQRDGVARKEAKHRASHAKMSLINFIEQNYTPGNPKTCWFAQGKRKNIDHPREISKLISEICDQVYIHCPKINNEMLNCDKLSGAGASARREVAEAMANNPHKENLGLTGFGPEVAIYRTVFKDTGLHIITPNGNWQLTPPDKNKQPQLSEVWQKIEEMLENSDKKGRAEEVKTIIDVLKNTPFGLREGPAPLLLIHYLLVNSDSVAVYEEGVFKPFFGDAECALMLKRPELFTLRRYSPTGVRKKVVQSYLQVINTDALSLVNGIRNQTILSVVVPLTEFIKTLPDYTMTTRDLSPNALRLRNVLVNARDPQELIFKEIPQSLGFEPIETSGELSNLPPASEFRDALWGALTELRDTFSFFSDKVKKTLVQHLSINHRKSYELPEFRRELQTQVAGLNNKTTDTKLKPILTTLCQKQSDDDNWALQVAAQIVKKPVPNWRDADIEPFVAKLEDIRTRIHNLTKIAQSSQKFKKPMQNSRYITITLPDGKVLGKVVHFEKNQEASLTTEFKTLFDKQNSETREHILTMLIDTMIKKGELA